MERPNCHYRPLLLIVKALETVACISSAFSNISWHSLIHCSLAPDQKHLQKLFSKIKNCFPIVQIQWALFCYNFIWLSASLTPFSASVFWKSLSAFEAPFSWFSSYITLLAAAITPSRSPPWLLSLTWCSECLDSGTNILRYDLGFQ